MSDLQDLLSRERVLRRHDLRARAYVEGKTIYRELALQRDNGWGPLRIILPFKPIHVYMHLLPGFNTFFAPAKYTGWRRLRAVEVHPCPEERALRFELSVPWLEKMGL